MGASSAASMEVCLAVMTAVTKAASTVGLMAASKEPSSADSKVDRME